MSYAFLLNLVVAGEVIRVESMTSTYNGRKYLSFELEGSESDSEAEALAVANRYRIVLESLDQIPESTLDFLTDHHHGVVTHRTIENALEEAVAEIAEYLEVEFEYSRNGRRRVYSPVALWESSDSCEWEQSSEYGITHGWDV